MSYGRYLEAKRLNGPPASAIGLPPPPPPDAAEGGVGQLLRRVASLSPHGSPSAGTAAASRAEFDGGEALSEALQAKTLRLGELQADDIDAAGSVGPGSPGSEAAREEEGGEGEREDHHPGLGLSTPPSPGRTGVTLKKEGWLLKKTSTKPHRWQKRWFVVMTKQEHGLVASRTLQYYTTPPDHPDIETAAVDLAEPRHAIPLYADRVLSRYDGVKFRLMPGTGGQFLGDSDKTYAFQAESVHDATSWVSALTPGKEELGEFLLDAAQEGNRTAVTHALQVGAPVNHRTGPGLSPLQWACVNGHAGCVSELLLAGAAAFGPSSCSEDGWTPVHAAAYGGHASVVAPLIVHSADLNAVAADGRTAYELAEEQGHADILAELMRMRGRTRHHNALHSSAFAFDDEQSTEHDLMRSDFRSQPPESESESELSADGGDFLFNTGLQGSAALNGSPEQDRGTLFLRKSSAAGALRGHSARAWLSPEQDASSLTATTPPSSSLARMADALPTVGTPERSQPASARVVSQKALG
eukprot:COSAG02_NODE_2441_length_8858_cov_31.570271_2_plen_527_part_00